MTAHFKCASNLKCIDRHRDLFLFCLFFLVISIFFATAFSFLSYCWNRGTLM